MRSTPLTTETSSDLRVARNGHIATITLNKPPHNMMSVALATAIADALHAMDDDRDVRVVVLAAEGKSFCAGADLTQRADEIGIQARADVPTSNPLYDQVVRLLSTKKPIIAAVQGPAVGAGLGLALIADFRIAAPDARFAANFVRLGFHPGFALTYLLPRLIGHQNANLMFLTGRRIKPDEALAWGLIDQLIYADLLTKAVTELASEIAECAPLAVMSTRATLRAGVAEAARLAT